MGNPSWSLDLAVLVLQDARRRLEEVLPMKKSKNPSWTRKLWKLFKVALAIWKLLDFVRRLASDYSERKHALQLRPVF